MVHLSVCVVCCTGSTAVATQVGVGALGEAIALICCSRWPKRCCTRWSTVCYKETRVSDCSGLNQLLHGVSALKLTCIIEIRWSSHTHASPLISIAVVWSNKRSLLICFALVLILILDLTLGFFELRIGLGVLIIIASHWWRDSLVGGRVDGSGCRWVLLGSHRCAGVGNRHGWGQSSSSGGA